MAWLTRDRNLTANLFGPLTHGGDAVMIVGALHRAMHIKPSSVVRHADGDRFGAEIHVHLYRMRLRMSRGVQHRLLTDTHELMLNVRSVPLRDAADAEFQFDRLIRCRAGRSIAQGFDQVAGLESR